MNLTTRGAQATTRKESSSTLVEQHGNNNENVSTQSGSKQPEFIRFEPGDKANPYNWSKVSNYYMFSLRRYRTFMANQD